MLTRELMGSALLGLSWLTATLVALDAAIDVRALLKLLSKWKGSLWQGEAHGELASHAVEQRVRLRDGAQRALLFFDRGYTSAVAGGPVQLPGGQVLEVVGAPNAQVWVDAAERSQAAACASAAQFDALAATASAGTGGLRVVRTGVRAGQRVWLGGTRAGARLTVDLVATFDPRRFVRARLLATFGLIAVDLAWVALGTTLALWPPVFGAVSTLGAAVLLGHFLGMTPLAMASRERSRTPDVAVLRGGWERPAVAQEAADPAVDASLQR